MANALIVPVGGGGYGGGGVGGGGVGGGGEGDKKMEFIGAAPLICKPGKPLGM